MVFANSSRTLFAAACLSAGVAFVAPAWAQDAPQPSAPATEPAPPATQPTAPAVEPNAPAGAAEAVSDEKLQSFAVAFAEVEKIKQEYSQRLQAAGSETEQQQLQTEAGQKMLQAVENTEGMSVDEYNQIIESAQADPSLAERLTKIIGQTNQ